MGGSLEVRYKFCFLDLGIGRGLGEFLFIAVICCFRMEVFSVVLDGIGSSYEVGGFRFFCSFSFVFW